MDTHPPPQEVTQANMRCDGCGASGPWVTSGKRWALVPLGPGDTLDFRTGVSTALGVKVLACQACGHLRFYDARYL